jgi:hypothetical protein
MPWLKDPNNAIPIVDLADIKALWQQSKDLEAQPRQSGTMRILKREAAACSHSADIASVVYRLGMLELVKMTMGLTFRQLWMANQLMPCSKPSRQSR